MGELHIHNFVFKLISKQKIMPHDVILLQSAMVADGDGAAVVANLIALETAVQNKCPQWDHYFIRTICEFLLDQSMPNRDITPNQVQWIKNALTRGGITHTQNEFEILISIIEQADSVPIPLISLALDEICRMFYEQKRDVFDKNADIQTLDNNDPYCDLRRSINRILPALSRTCVHQETRAKGMLEMMVKRPAAPNSTSAFGFLKEKLAQL